MQPYEIVCAPLTVYVANVGATFPAIDAAPPGGTWFKLGTSGTKNYAEGGVTVTQGGTEQEFTPAGGTAPRKAYRTNESLKLGFELVDTSPDQWAKILDDLTVINTAQGTGIAGNKAFEVLRGTQVKAFAVLARGVSSVDETLNSQLEIASCYQSGDPAPKFDKGAPAGLAVEFTAIERTPGVFCTVRIQTTVAA